MAAKKQWNKDWRTKKDMVQDIEMEDLSDPFPFVGKVSNDDVDMQDLSNACGGICCTSVCEKKLLVYDLKLSIEECVVETLTKMLSKLKISD